MSDVPPEIISDIFSRLPVISLLRFRSLSKPFRSLIDSPQFIKSHLHLSLKSNSNKSLIVDRNGLKLLDFDLLAKSFETYYGGFKVVGSSNGLVCLTAGEDVYIANPSLRHHRVLPLNKIKYRKKRFWILVHSEIYGFGYDVVNDDYKVFQIKQFLDDLRNVVLDVYEVNVYSFKSNTWRKPKDFPHILYNAKHGVFVNGALHWIVTVKPRSEEGLVPSSEKIVSFDIATEEYRLITLPEYTPCEDGEMMLYDPDTEEYNMIPNEMVMGLWELGGRLCVQCKYKKKYLDVWVMNDYGIADSWTKLCSVAQPFESHRSEYEYVTAVAYSKDGKKMLLEQQGGRIVWYDLKLETVENIVLPHSQQVFRYHTYTDSPYVFKPYIHTDSLIRLRVKKPKITSGARTNVAHQEKEERKRKSPRRRDDVRLKGFKLSS